MGTGAVAILNRAEERAPALARHILVAHRGESPPNERLLEMARMPLTLVSGFESLDTSEWSPRVRWRGAWH